MSEAYARALPRPNAETLPFWEGARQHQLVQRWCLDCGKPHFYPRALCPFCLSEALEWRQVSGRGLRHASVINHKPAKGFNAPCVLCVVEFEEGVRLLSNLVTDAPPNAEALSIDMPVTVVFDDLTAAVTLPRPRPPS